MSEQAIQAYQEGIQQTEQEEPSRPFAMDRNPGPTRDLASAKAQEAPPPAEDLDIDLTIGLGEDPGYVHIGPPHSNAQPERKTQHGAGTQ